MLTRISQVIAFLAIVLVFGFGCFTVSKAIADATYNEQTQTQSYQNYTFFNATTTSATSTNDLNGGVLRVAGAKKVTFYFSHGGVSTTSTTGARFNVQTSYDYSTWQNFSKLVGSDVAATATSSVTIQGATSTVSASMDLSKDTFAAVRCVSTELATPLGTDGEQTCKASVEF